MTKISFENPLPNQIMYASRKRTEACPPLSFSSALSSYDSRCLSHTKSGSTRLLTAFARINARVRPSTTRHHTTGPPRIRRMARVTELLPKLNILFPALSSSASSFGFPSTATAIVAAALLPWRQIASTRLDSTQLGSY